MNVERGQQLVVSDIKLCQARILIGARAVAELKALQFRGHGKVCVSNLHGRQVANGCNTVCAVDVNLGIVHCVKRARKRSLRVPLTSRRNRIGAVLDTRPDVTIRRNRDVSNSVATQRYKLAGCVAALVLAVAVSERIEQPPLALRGLAALQHG